MIEGVDFYLKLWDFPNYASECFVTPNDDGTYDINLNTRYPREVLKKRMKHELAHILLNHFQDDRPVSEIEDEAEAYAEDMIVTVTDLESHALAFRRKAV